MMKLTKKKKLCSNLNINFPSLLFSVTKREEAMKFLKNLLDFFPNSKFLNFSRTQQKGSSKFSDPSSSAPSSIAETGQSSNSINTSSSSESQFVCEICAEPKSQNESFNSKGCSHGFCSDCIAKYIAIKIQENNITSISCPEPTCKGVLEPEFCSSILPPEVFDRWNHALRESMILGSQRFYCPYENCSALLVVNDGIRRKIVKKKKSECPHCNRLFCGQCKVPWHEGMKCNKFQRLKKDETRRGDVMVMELVKERGWQRCPKCRFYVDKTDGCQYMKCRCGQAFCYIHGTLVLRDHRCSRCLMVNKVKKATNIRLIPFSKLKKMILSLF